MELETINKLFLELSQFTTATTAKELELQRELERLRAAQPAVPDDAVRKLRADLQGMQRHLRAIERTANFSRTQSRRMQWIAARCRSAINGDEKWRDLPVPTHKKPDWLRHDDEGLSADELIGGNS